MSASAVDPDISAAFSGASTAEPASHVDSDIQSAFAQKGSEQGSASDDETPEAREAKGLGGAAEGVLHWVSSKIAGPLSRNSQGGYYPEVRKALTYEPKTEEGRALMPVGKEVGSAIDYPGTWVTKKTGIPELGALTNTALQQGPFLLAKAPGGGETPYFGPPRAAPPVTSHPSAGAAGAATDLSAVSPELRSAAQDASQSGTLHAEALERHIRAETLPMPEGESPPQLTKGQATHEPQQISDERNLVQDPDTAGILTQRFDVQNQKLGASLGEIRRRATPDIVQRNNLEHGQAAIDSIKTVDNGLVQDTRAKYKALADQNGGEMPIDTGAAATTADAALKKGFLSKLVDDHPVLGPVMDKLRSGESMTFEDWESATKALSEVQRRGSSEGTAAGIIRNQFENMPLSEGAQGLRGMLNEAKSAAKRRFDTIEQNPAYKAAVEDNVPKSLDGLHKIGEPSPLADSFIDRYFLGHGPNASKAYIARVKTLVPDPAFSQTIEAATLNRLRDAAGVDEVGTMKGGGFGHASFRNLRNAIDPKADVLLSQKSAESTEQLRDVSSDITHAGPGTAINRSHTASTLQRFGAEYPTGSTMAKDLASIGGDLVAGHAGGIPLIAKRMGEKVFAQRAAEKSAQSISAAKRAFAEDATAPGAGVNARTVVTKP